MDYICIKLGIPQYEEIIKKIETISAKLANSSILAASTGSIEVVIDIDLTEEERLQFEYVSDKLIKKIFETNCGFNLEAKKIEKFPFFNKCILNEEDLNCEFDNTTQWMEEPDLYTITGRLFTSNLPWKYFFPKEWLGYGLKIKDEIRFPQNYIVLYN